MIFSIIYSRILIFLFKVKLLKFFLVFLCSISHEYIDINKQITKFNNINTSFQKEKKNYINTFFLVKGITLILNRTLKNKMEKGR